MFYKPSNVSSLNHLKLGTPSKIINPNNHYFSLVCHLLFYNNFAEFLFKIFQFHNDKTETYLKTDN